MALAAEFRVLLVVPTLGQRPATLDRTLRSVVCQCDVEVDVVVVAPVDSERLRAAAAQHGAQVVIAGGHISAAVNRGFAMAGPKHRYVAWLGDDDYLHAGSLAMAASRLEQRPDGVVAFGSCDYVDEAGRLMFTLRPPPGAAWWLQFVPGLIKQEACLFRRDAVLKVGGLDEGLRYAMDLDLLLRLRRVGSFVRSEEVLAAFCWHAGSITIANRDQSLAEAQSVQRRWSTGLVRSVNPLAQALVRRLLKYMSNRINRRHLSKV